MWRLIDYVVQHFADEEALMQAAAYPELSVHCGMHEYLAAESMRISARFMNGEMVLAADLALFIMRWLREHIAEADKRFVAYLAARR